MNSTITQCPNCKADLQLKSSGQAVAFNEDKVNFINLYNDNKSDAYCTNCGSEAFKKAGSAWNIEMQTLIDAVNEGISKIPVVSIQSPVNWDYDVCSVVSSTVVDGRGLMYKIIDFFTDLFGLQSDNYSENIEKLENLCLTKLRKQAVTRGGNAIIATTITHTEVGISKGMVKISVVGTAVKLKNVSVLGNKELEDALSELTTMGTRFNYLNTFSTLF